MLTLTMMGLGTVAIGLLPTYGQIGVAAPALLYLCCTSAKDPVIDSDWVADDACAVAVGSHEPDRRDRPRVFKTVGMSWQDLVVAAAVAEA